MENADLSLLSCPFKTGGIVTGEKFIGRNEQIKKCLRKLLDGGSVAIRGLPHIGKTSLAWKLLYTSEYWTDRNAIFIFIDLSKCETFFHFWRKVADEIENTYDGMSADGAMRDLLGAVETAGDNYEKIDKAVSAVFACLHKKNIQTVLCIDKFDDVVRVFGDSKLTENVCYYNSLTELISKEKLSLIITIRRSLHDLTVNPGGNSTLDGKIETMPLHGFNDDEMTAFREYAARHGLALSDDDWTALTEQAGRSPSMLSMSSTALLDAGQGKSVRQVLKDYEPAHYPYFNGLLKFMRENDNRDLRRMIQLFIGPKYNLSRIDINELQHSGYIWVETVNGREQYVTLSKCFELFLREEARKGLDIEIWPLMEAATKRLRDAIETGLRSVYGDIWEDELCDKARLINNENKKKPKEEKKLFINMKNVDDFERDGRRQRLIDWLGYLEYMYIIEEYWQNVFQFVFKGLPLNTVKDNLRKIHSARNPYGHFNGKLLSDLEVEKADLACKEILECLN